MSTELQRFNTQLVDAKRSFPACPRFSVPCSPVFPLARSSVPFSSRKERKTSKRPHFAGDIWPFFCLCLLYIPVALGSADRPPFPRRSSTLPLFLTPLSIKHTRVKHSTSGVHHQNKTAANDWHVEPRYKWTFQKKGAHLRLFLYLEWSFDIVISMSTVLPQMNLEPWHTSTLRPVFIGWLYSKEIFYQLHFYANNF